MDRDQWNLGTCETLWRVSHHMEVCCGASVTRVEHWKERRRRLSVTTEGIPCAILLWLWQKTQIPRSGLSSGTGTGSLITMSLLRSAQGEPSISCHGVKASGVIFSVVPPIFRTDLFITSFVRIDKPTSLYLKVPRWLRYYHWGYRSEIDDRHRDMNPIEEPALSSVADAHVLQVKHSGSGTLIHGAHDAGTL